MFTDALLDAAKRHALDVTVDVRRHEKALADATVFALNDCGPAMHAYCDHLKEQPWIDSLRLQGRRISVKFSDSAIQDLRKELLNTPSTVLRPSRALAHRRVLLDFCDPNLNKALHLGHLRNVSIARAIYGLFNSAKFPTTIQMIVSDMGRSFAEGMAGFVRFGKEIAPTKAADQVIGNLYAQYVAKHPPAANAIHTADEPVARELHVRQDLADWLLHDWHKGNAKTVALAARIAKWVLAAQLATLKRLHMHVDSVVYESHFFHDPAGLLAAGLSQNIFKRDSEGRIYYPTGSADYPVVPLTRSDALPTEHFRALALWHALATDWRYSDCIHVMGSEWLPSTRIRERMLVDLGSTHLTTSYRKVVHEMVTVHGDKMKSSGGSATLIDDLLDRIVGDLGTTDGAAPDDLAQILLTVFLLSYPLNKPVAFSYDRLMDRACNPGWAIVDVLRASPGPKSNISASRRFATLQAERYRGAVEMAIAACDPAALVNFTTNIAKWNQAAGFASCDVIQPIITAAMRTLGIPLAQP